MLNRLYLAAVLLLCAFAGAAAAPRDPAGVYVVVPMDRETTLPRPLPPALAQAFVTGANVRPTGRARSPSPAFTTGRIWIGNSRS